MPCVYMHMLQGLQAAETGAHPEPTKARVMPDSSFMTFLMIRGAVKTWSRVCITPCLQAWKLCFRNNQSTQKMPQACMGCGTADLWSNTRQASEITF